MEVLKQLYDGGEEQLRLCDLDLEPERHLPQG